MFIDHSLWDGARALDGLAIDHIGVVVEDCDEVVDLMRSHGFQVSDPQPIMGSWGKLGQQSAHCVFGNAYLEISAPERGTNNHLLPYLELGPGIRILALRSDDSHADQVRLSQMGLAAGPVREAKRDVIMPQSSQTAEFLWFPVRDVLPGVLIAVVEHRDPETVYAEQLRQHPNGARDMHDVLFGGASGGLGALVGHRRYGPTAMFSEAADADIVGFSVSGLEGLQIDHPAFSLRGVAGPPPLERI